MTDFVLGYTGQQVQDTLDEVYKIKSDIEYQTPTIVGTQVRLTKQSDTKTLKFYLSTELSGGAITISIDGGVTDVALKDGEGNAVTELAAGLKEVVYVAPFFILRSSGGLQEFFGDGSDGTIPDLNTATSAPNGGTVANLWDMNAGTVFTTGTLSSASDQVIFQIDFGKPVFMATNAFYVSGMALSTGTRTLANGYSDDGVNWTEGTIGTISTTPYNQALTFPANVSKRFWRLVLKAGGSNCTLSANGLILNYISGDLTTTKIWRILEPSTLNGEAVVKQYTEYVLPVGYEHTTQNPCQGLIIYSQGNATVNGILDMSQKAGLAPNGNAIPMLITKKAYVQNKVGDDSYVKSLLHFNGIDAQTTFEDSANNREWVSSGAIVTTATSKFGTGSVNLTGANKWLYTQASEDFRFGVNNFTIDFWVRRSSSGSNMAIFGQGSISNPTLNSIQCRFNASNNLLINVRTTGNLSLSSTTTITSLTNWTHIAIVRDGTTLKLFINGTQDATTLSLGTSALNYSNQPFSIGRFSHDQSTEMANHYIDEFRISNGIARWTSNFTPPTTEYTSSIVITEPKTLEKYFQLTNVLQTLRGGYGGNGGQGGQGNTGNSGAIGGIGGAGRQNLGGFGGGGGGGNAVTMNPGKGGSITYPELGGGRNIGNLQLFSTASPSTNMMESSNGAGGLGGYFNNVTISINADLTAKGGGTGGFGGVSNTSGNVSGLNPTEGGYSGGLVCLISYGDVVINGTMMVNGGAGGNGSNGLTNGSGTAGGGGGGGGAGGGVIAVFYKGIYSNLGTIQANGGSGGTGGSNGTGGGTAGTAGTSGSVGTIHTQKI